MLAWQVKTRTSQQTQLFIVPWPGSDIGFCEGGYYVTSGQPKLDIVKLLKLVTLILDCFVCEQEERLQLLSVLSQT